MELPQSEVNEEWAGCCSKTNSTFLKYITMVIICVIILIFSITMIVIRDGNNCEVYFSLISAIMGIFAPSPSMNRQK